MNLLNMLLMGCMGASADAAADGQAQSNPWYIIVIYIVIFGAIIYFLMIRPQRKQRQQQEQTMSSIEPGDSVLTTSGFYGTIVAVNADTIIVEFGNNKNCRIPMSKQAISQIEKANAGSVAQAAAGNSGSESASNRKKFFGWKKEDQEAAQAEAEAAASKAEAAAEKTATELADAAKDAAKDIAADAKEAVSEVVEDAAEKID